LEWRPWLRQQDLPDYTNPKLFLAIPKLGECHPHQGVKAKYHDVSQVDMYEYHQTLYQQ
jgi:hypothetical protein